MATQSNIKNKFISLDSEIWVDINGFSGYQISNAGRVRSNKKSNRHPLPECGWRILRGGQDKDGYRRLTLSDGKRKGHVKIAHLVFEAFIGKRKKGIVVRHKNGINTDDRSSNLMPGTQKQNIHDKIKHGTMAKGETHGLSKLKKNDVLEIKKSKKGVAFLSKKYGVSMSCICDINAKRTWAWL